MGYDKEGWERGALPAFRKGGTHENRPFDRHFIHPAAEGYRHPELAERFEVSRRTIGRDIDALCRAGIPIQTRQGTNGGISILENFRMDRTLLTGEEMRDILAGLRSLDSVNGTNRYGQLMEKLSAGSSNFLTGDQSVLIGQGISPCSSICPPGIRTLWHPKSS